MPHMLELATGIHLSLDDAALSRLRQELLSITPPVHQDEEPTASSSDAACTPQPPSFARQIADDHAYWQQHTGGSGHSDLPEWGPSDATRAEAFYAGLPPKAKVFVDTLIDHPGRLLSSAEIMATAPDTFANQYAIAGSINGLRKLREDAERRYPFYWWGRKPTDYAMKSSVAELFRAARSAIGR